MEKTFFTSSYSSPADPGVNQAEARGQVEGFLASPGGIEEFTEIVHVDADTDGLLMDV